MNLIKHYTTLLFVLIVSISAKSQSVEQIQKVREAFEEKPEVYLSFDAEKYTKSLHLNLSLDYFDNGRVYVYANASSFQLLLDNQIDFKIERSPGDIDFDPNMKTWEEIISGDYKSTWDFYPTYEAYVAMMYQFETDFPELVKIYNIGQTVLGRDLLFAKVTSNVSEPKQAPNFMYTSTMHGDEATGFILMLRLIDHFANNYGTDDEITDMLDNIVFWICPNENPDGTYTNDNSTVSGATRSNANGVDLNRNYPNPISQHSVQQPETIAMMNFTDTISFVMSANMHGGIELVNYPYDSWESNIRKHSDHNWFHFVSREYADTAQYYSPSGYMTGMDNGVTHGGDWYVVYGSRQDYFVYYQYCREVTLELSNTKLLPPAQLPAHWNYNYRALINYIKQATYGITGVVKDMSTNDAIAAKIEIIGHDNYNSEVYSKLPYGDFYRPILAGTYNIEVSADGYMPVIIGNVEVQNHQAVFLEIFMGNAYTLSLEVYPENAGIVDGEGIYFETDEAFLSATANFGYEFDNWTIDGAEISNQESFYYVMPNHDVTIAANFIAYDIREVSFIVDMEDAVAVNDVVFDPEIHDVYISGDFADWAEPGSEKAYKLYPLGYVHLYDFTENWSLFNDFTTDLSPWITVQYTSGTTWGSSDYNFPNEGEEWAFMTFNPSEVDPPMAEQHHPVNGDRCVVAIQYNDLNDNKWLISPELHITQDSELSFWAKSYTHAYGEERFKVHVSTSGTAQEDFVKISEGDFIEAPLDWTKYTFPLADFADETIRFAIQYVSYDAFIFMIDDFIVTDVVLYDYKKEENEFQYSITLNMLDGEYEYKYFFVEDSPTWDMAEMPSGTSRLININSDLIIEDTWGDYDAEYFTLTLEADPPDGGSITGEGSYQYMQTVKITANPESDYLFSGWFLDGVFFSDNDEYSFNMPASDITIVGKFTEKTYDLTLLSEPEEGGTVSGEGNYPKDHPVEISATANNNYMFVNWAIDDLEISDQATFNYNMPAEDVILTANFIRTYSVTLLTEPDGAGNVSGDGSYPEGHVVNINVVPNSGYYFLNWTDIYDDNVSENAGFQHTMLAEDVTFIANLELINLIDNLENDKIVIYPNPATGFFTVISDSNILEVNVFCINGKNLFSRIVNDTNVLINIPDAETGVYFVKIITDDDVITRKITFVK